MKSYVIKLCSSLAGIIICGILAGMFEDGSPLWNGMISAGAALNLYFIIYLVIFIIFLIGNTKQELDSAKKYRVQSEAIKWLNKQKCDNIIQEELITLFKLSSRELMIGEKIMDSRGMMIRKTKDIKDTVNRCAAEFSQGITFMMNSNTGEAYKVLIFEKNEEKAYYSISFDELNRCMEMNESVRAKYKRITSENWRNIV